MAAQSVPGRARWSMITGLYRGDVGGVTRPANKDRGRPAARDASTRHIRRGMGEYLDDFKVPLRRAWRCRGDQSSFPRSRARRALANRAMLMLGNSHESYQIAVKRIRAAFEGDLHLSRKRRYLRTLTIGREGSPMFYSIERLTRRKTRTVAKASYVFRRTVGNKQRGHSPV